MPDNSVYCAKLEMLGEPATLHQLLRCMFAHLSAMRASMEIMWQFESSWAHGYSPAVLGASVGRRLSVLRASHPGRRAAVAAL